MSARSFDSDTEPSVADRIADRWRTMTFAEKAALADQLSVDVAALAVAGIRFERPGATDLEILQELARRRFGPELADAAYTAEARA